MKKYIKYTVLPLIITLNVLLLSSKTEASKGGKLINFVSKTTSFETKKPILVEHYSIEKTQNVSHKLDSLLQGINKRQDFHGSLLVAKNGIEAVKKCQDNLDIDLILMDMRMPEMDGYEATKQIRKFNKNVIIIAQTAFALSNDREKTINVGCNDYIMKPINQVQLKNLITTLINNKNANRIPIKII